MQPESKKMAGVILILLPTVMIGGLSLLSFLIGSPEYQQNKLRQDLWRAGHAHAGVFLILSLVALRYVDETSLSETSKWVVRVGIPVSAILIPAAFFLSVLKPEATHPNAFINLAYGGAILLAASVILLGVGLLKKSGPRERKP